MDPKSTSGRIIQKITKHYYTQSIKDLGLMVAEMIFVLFSHCKYMGDNVPWGGTSWASLAESM